ncbi:hypothetical protein ACKWTF_016065 [Chironomus riparius]
MAIKIILVPILVIFLSFGNIESVKVDPDICKGINFGFLAHPDPQRCTEYIICFNEEPYFFTCAYPDQIFFLPYTYCVKGDPITCEVLVNVTTLSPPITTTSTTTSTTTLSTTTSTTTESSIDTTTERTLPDEFCIGINFGVFTHPHNCTKFVVCTFETPMISACQNPYMIFFNGSCVPGDPATCEAFSRTTLSSDTTIVNVPPTTTTERLTTTVTIPTTRSPIPSIPTPPVTPLSTTTVAQAMNQPPKIVN